MTEIIAKTSHIRKGKQHYHSGQTYKKLREDWSKTILEQHIINSNIEFNEVVKTLENNFLQLIKKSESEGVFDEDDKREEEKFKMFFRCNFRN